MASYIHRASALALAGVILMPSTSALAAEEQAPGVAPTEKEARLFCEDAAAKLQILAEDMDAYMTECVGEYLESPPGDLGVSPEPGGTGY